MAKYLKKFENHTAYETAESGLILPNVSICVTEGDVHYNPYNPPIIDGHEYVDLGLPSGTLWAKYNVGATSETEYGNYYQYGKGAAQYAETRTENDYKGIENPLATSADTAVQVWGGSWHIPTQTQLNELTANTTYEWTTINSVNGGKFTAQNGNYLFIPAAGSYSNGSLVGLGTSSLLWSSTPIDKTRSYNLHFYDSQKYVEAVNRYHGCSIRPVVG